MGCDKIKIDLVSVIDSFLKVWNVLVCIWWRWHIHKKFSQLRNQNPKEFSSIIKQEDYCQAMLYFLLLLGSSFIWNFLAKILQIFPPQTRHLTTIEIGCIYYINITKCLSPRDKHFVSLGQTFLYQRGATIFVNILFWSWEELWWCWLRDGRWMWAKQTFFGIEANKFVSEESKLFLWARIFRSP